MRRLASARRRASFLAARTRALSARAARRWSALGFMARSSSCSTFSSSSSLWNNASRRASRFSSRAALSSSNLLLIIRLVIFADVLVSHSAVHAMLSCVLALAWYVASLSSYARIFIILWSGASFFCPGYIVPGFAGESRESGARVACWRGCQQPALTESRALPPAHARRGTFDRATEKHLEECLKWSWQAYAVCLDHICGVKRPGWRCSNSWREGR
mmetsp:Transcript_15041/g.38952  ORF Transcript_15041/g.38952 Transcript_15041/m.38952 type:complete len:217 (-) Transcript_15041:19-669(-)